MKKRIIKILVIVIITSSLLFVSLIIYIKNDWKSFTTEKEMTELIVKIKNAEQLPKKFYELYELDNPKSLDCGINGQIINYLLGYKYIVPPSELASWLSRFSYNHVFDKRRVKYRNISISWKLEAETTQKQCLNWVVGQYDFLYRSIGIKKASKYYFNKEINELDEFELATFVIMMRNPSLYNPIKRKKTVDIAAKELLKKYN